MQLKYPFLISARLLPALKIGDGWLSFNPKTCVFYIDTPEFEYEIKDFSPGCMHTVQDCFQDILGFFGSAIETAKYYEDTERLFPEHVTKWLVTYEYDICDMDCALDEKDLIT